MKREKLVLEIVGEGIKSHGFTYVRSKDKLSWDFKRKVGKITQWITVEEEQFFWHPENPKALHLFFITDAHDSRPWAAIDIIPDERLPEPGIITKHVFAGAIAPGGSPALNVDSCKAQYWSFETEEDYIAILKEFVSIIEDYGIDKLNELSKEGNVLLPTNEMGASLFSSPQSLNEEFISHYQIDVSSYSRENVSKWFEIIDQIITENRDIPYEEVQGVLIKIAAFLGEQIRKELGGEWLKGISEDIVVLNKVNSYYFSGYFPLDNVVESWQYNNIENLKEEFLILLDGKLPVSGQQQIELKNRWNALFQSKKRIRESKR